MGFAPRDLGARHWESWQRGCKGAGQEGARELRQRGRKGAGQEGAWESRQKSRKGAGQEEVRGSHYILPRV